MSATKHRLSGSDQPSENGGAGKFGDRLLDAGVGPHRVEIYLQEPIDKAILDK